MNKAREYMSLKVQGGGGVAGELSGSEGERFNTQGRKTSGILL